MTSKFDCYSCVHFTHLYDDEQLHTLDDMTDGWYEPVAVYGCSLLFDGLECDYKPRNTDNNENN